MNEKFRLTIVIVLLVILFLSGALLIRDFLILFLGNKLNDTWFFIINFLLLFIFIEILSKTKFGKYVESKLVKKGKK